MIAPAARLGRCGIKLCYSVQRGRLFNAKDLPALRNILPCVVLAERILSAPIEVDATVQSRATENISAMLLCGCVSVLDRLGRSCSVEPGIEYDIRLLRRPGLPRSRA